MIDPPWRTSTYERPFTREGNYLVDMVEAPGLKQWVDFPTHKLGNTLDLIITELAAEVQAKNISWGPYILDHCINTCMFNLPKTKINMKQIKYGILKKADIVDMISDMDLDSINLDSENLEEILSSV